MSASNNDLCVVVPAASRRVSDMLAPQRWFARHVRNVPPVPAYFFHQFNPMAFESLCYAIKRKNLRTITASDLLGGNVDAARSLMLTFDDGWSSAWSIGLPIARRLGIRFTAFIVSALVEENDEVRATLDEGAAMQELVARDRGEHNRLTWGEVKALHDSGYVDIQSHSLHHAMVFHSDAKMGQVDEFGSFPLPGDVPLLVRENGHDVPRRRLPTGMPLHPVAPALWTTTRYLEDENRIETDNERRLRIRDDLSQAKSLIESHLPGHRVHTLAPPWAAINQDVLALAAETGHEQVMMGYPYECPVNQPPNLHVHPRMKGDAIWFLLRGSLLGLPHYFTSRKQMRTLLREGGMP